MPVDVPTKNEFEKWIPARWVSRKLHSVGDHKTLINALADRLRVALVVAAAEHRSHEDEEVEAGPLVIPTDHWKTVDAPAFNDVWQSGQLTVWPAQRDRHGRSKIDYFGVRFSPVDLGAMFASAGIAELPTSPIEAPAKHAGGAPRKEFWDDLLIEMFQVLWLGELKPNRQADLERAMLDWASGKGYSLGESSVKAPARKLFAAWKSEVKN